MAQYCIATNRDYQLCDITDPMVAKYINDPENVGVVCDVSAGVCL